MLAGWRVGGLAAAGEGGLEAWVGVLVVPASGTSARAGRRAGGGSPLAAASLSAVTCLIISDTFWQGHPASAHTSDLPQRPKHVLSRSR